jgi:hypothetical protein
MGIPVESCDRVDIEGHGEVACAGEGKAREGYLYFSWVRDVISGECSG